MSMYSKGMIDLKFQEKENQINNLNTKIINETIDRKRDIKALINGGTTQEGDIIRNGITNINYTIYGNPEEEIKGLKDIIEESIPEDGFEPNKVIITDAEGKMISSEVSSEVFNTLKDLPDNIDMTTLLQNAINKTHRVNSGAILTNTIPNVQLTADSPNGWYYLNTTGAKNSIYVYRTIIYSNVDIKIINPIDVSVDYDFITAKNTYSEANDILAESLNNYSNILGIDFTIEDVNNTNSKNLIVDTYFFNRNQDNRWFEYTNTNIFIKYAILCGGI